VPADELEGFMDDVAVLGELHERSLDSDDVTDRYYDRENRMKNKLARQESLRERLKSKATDRDENWLAVDRELNQVTQDIEADKAQLQRWAKDSEMATVYLSVRERKDYVPTTAPAFGTTISRTFSGSVELLTGFGKGLVLIAVALAPWLPLIVLPFYILIRRALRTPPAPPIATVIPADVPPATT
jgi:hypothetical protein